MTEKPFPKDKRRLPTSFDVAQLAGVSRSAVSRTFVPGSSIASATKARVLEAARVLRYQPHHAARSLTTNRSMVVALAVSHLDNQFHPPLVERFVDYMGRQGYRVMIFITRGEREGEPLLDELLRLRVDGLVLASLAPGTALLAGCREIDLPVVMANNILAQEQVPQVSGCNIQGATTIARFLMAGGHRRYGFIGGIGGVSTSDLRRNAFAAALTSGGFPPPTVHETDFTFQGAVAATSALLAAPDAPDALFCVNDHMAFAACQAASAMGLEAGRAVSIIGFDNVEIAQWTALSLTSYAQKADTMAEEAADLLLELIQTGWAERPSRTVTGRLVVRGSARRPKSGIITDWDGEQIWIAGEG